MDKIIRIGMDTSKHVFQLHGVNAGEKPVLRKKMRRKEMIDFFTTCPPTSVAIEACGGSHHWARLGTSKVSEAGYASEIFGVHDKRSIMNYGIDSVLTQTDIDDLARLYQAVWSGVATKINGTPIRLMKPFSHFKQKAELPPQFALVAQIAQ